MRKKSKNKGATHGRDVASRVRKYIGSAALALVSAVSGAVIESATDVVKVQLRPLLAEAGCSVSELWSRNATPFRFTVLVLPFDNDPGGTHATALAQAISARYGFNVIASCKQIRVPAQGDRHAMVQQARARYAALARKYDADIIITGAIGPTSNQSRILTVTRRGIDTIFHNDGPDESEEYDATRAGAYVERQLFSYVSGATEQIGSAMQCMPAIFMVCTVPLSEEPTDRRVDVQGRINYLRRMMDLNLFLAIDGNEQSLRQVSTDAANLALFLFKQYDVTIINNESVLDISQRLLAYQHQYWDIMRNLTPQDSLQTLNLAQVSLERGISCKSSTDARSALSGYNSYLEDFLAIKDDDLRQARALTAVMARLGIVKAIALLRALDAERPDAAQLEALFVEQQHAIDSTSNLIPSWIAQWFPEDDAARRLLNKRVDDVTRILRAMVSGSRAELKSLLVIGRNREVCAEKR